MAHLIERIAYVGQEPWHGLGTKLDNNTPFDEWFVHSGLNYEVKRSPVDFLAWTDDGGRQTPTPRDFPERHVLYRGDTGAPLSVVGQDYRIVQPRQVLEFYRDLVSQYGMTLETAGVLADGKRVWALANTGAAVTIGDADLVKQYVLLATSYDGTMATVAKHTSVRVVCNNTLTLANSNGEPAIRVHHGKDFVANDVKVDLGLMERDFAHFGDVANLMHDTPVDPTFAELWYAGLLLDKDFLTAEEMESAKARNRVLGMLMGIHRDAKGAEDTIWGLVNGVTALVDHVKGRTRSTAMNSAWFGAGAALKEKAWKRAVQTMESMQQPDLLQAA